MEKFIKKGWFEISVKIRHLGFLSFFKIKLINKWWGLEFYGAHILKLS
jgi:hypothetical protein